MDAFKLYILILLIALGLFTLSGILNLVYRHFNLQRIFREDDAYHRHSDDDDNQLYYTTDETEYDDIEERLPYNYYLSYRF